MGQTPLVCPKAPTSLPACEGGFSPFSARRGGLCPARKWLSSEPRAGRGSGRPGRGRGWRGRGGAGGVAGGCPRDARSSGGGRRRLGRGKGGRRPPGGGGDRGVAPAAAGGPACVGRVCVHAWGGCMCVYMYIGAAVRLGWWGAGVECGNSQRGCSPVGVWVSRHPTHQWCTQSTAAYTHTCTHTPMRTHTHTHTCAHTCTQRTSQANVGHHSQTDRSTVILRCGCEKGSKL